MIAFKPIGLEDKELIAFYYPLYGNGDCNLSFGTLFTRQIQKESSYALVNGQLVIRWKLNNGQFAYTMPVGHGDQAETIRQLREQAEQEGTPLYIYGIFPSLQQWFEDKYQGQFIPFTHRDFSDYVYLRNDMVSLQGKHFQPKRNHLNQFRKNHEYEYKPLTIDLIPHCLNLLEQWYDEREDKEDKNLLFEHKAVQVALRHFDQLDLFGGSIWVNDQIIGFSYGAPVRPDMFAIHIEKASKQIDGAYNVLNQEFARHIPEQYIYLNREEDLGLSGLRKSKLSYQPAFLQEKGYIQLTG